MTRGLVLVCVAVLASVLGPGCDDLARPNIIVVMTDDLDARSVATLAAAGLMPNLTTHVIDAGMTFRNSFATNPLCCPSRATFLTGQYPHNHGAFNNLPDTGIKAVDDSSTVATWLHAAGYRTCHIGKYMNGYGKVAQFTPTYVPPGWDDWHGLVDISTYRVYGYTINHNGVTRDYPYDPFKPHYNYQTDVLAELGVSFVEDSDARRDDQPFFLTVTPLAVHNEVTGGTLGDLLDLVFGDYRHTFEETIRPAPRHEGTTDGFALRHPPNFDEADVSDKPGWVRSKGRIADFPGAMENLERQYRDRLASLRAVDDMIGSLVAALERTGELDNTVIVFTSDNGWLLGEHRLSSKQAAYEESARVPLYVRAPGVAGPLVVDEVALNNDLAPTIADLAGATPTHAVDGRSLLPLFAGGTASWRTRFLIEHWMHVVHAHDVPTYSAVRTASSEPLLPNRLFVNYRWWEPLAREHYDLNADPYELRSLHHDRSVAWERAVMNDWIDALRVAAGDAARAAEGP